jgi:excisionase family DNA binding protein
MADVTAPQLLSAEDVARSLGASRRTVDRIVASGELPRVRVGPGRRLARYEVAAVQALVRRSRESRPYPADPEELEFR